jgi:hypothetical protein
MCDKNMDSTGLEEDCFNRLKRISLFYCTGLKEKIFSADRNMTAIIISFKFSSFALNSKLLLRNEKRECVSKIVL